MVELVRGRSGSADPHKDVHEAMREKRKPSFVEKCSSWYELPELALFLETWLGYANPTYLGEKGLGWTMT